MNKVEAHLPPGPRITTDAKVAAVLPKHRALYYDGAWREPQGATWTQSTRQPGKLSAR